MILKETTIKYAGYNPSTLSKGSHKRICYSCDCCGRVRWIEFRVYKDLCSSCVVKGIPKSDETKAKMVKNHFDNSGKNNPNWKPKVIKIKGLDGHYIMSNVIIYLPHNLHVLNHYDLKNNKNMKKINELSFRFLKGEL